MCSKMCYEMCSRMCYKMCSVKYTSQLLTFIAAANEGAANKSRTVAWLCPDVAFCHHRVPRSFTYPLNILNRSTHSTACTSFQQKSLTCFTTNQTQHKLDIQILKMQVIHFYLSVFSTILKLK